MVYKQPFWQIAFTLFKNNFVSFTKSHRSEKGRKKNDEIPPPPQNK